MDDFVGSVFYPAITVFSSYFSIEEHPVLTYLGVKKQCIKISLYLKQKSLTQNMNNQPSSIFSYITKVLLLKKKRKLVRVGK